MIDELKPHNAPVTLAEVKLIRLEHTIIELGKARVAGIQYVPYIKDMED
jgi:hypothetical protein